MPEELLLEELETDNSVAESLLKKVEEALHGIIRDIGSIAEKMKGTAFAFENAWLQIVMNVAKGQTAEMHASRPRLLSHFEKRLYILKQDYALLTRHHKEGQTEIPDADFLLPEIAGMERLKARVFDRWHTAEDLEKLAVEHYPLSQARLQQIAATHAPPPASWYADESKPF